MKASTVAAFVLSGVLALGTVLLWMAMREANEQQVARLAEAESYASRSQLVRNVDTLLGALRSVRLFWQAYGHQPVEQWSSDAGIELDHFSGISMILWNDPVRDIRYVRTQDKPVLDYRPGDEEWASYVELRNLAQRVQSAGIIGPRPLDDGGFEFIIIVAAGEDSGQLAARVNVGRMLDNFLADESPGFAIQVHAADQLIYERGEASPDAPEDWVRTGMIRNDFGTVWEVTHLPTNAMLDSYSRTAIDLTLLLGLVVAILMGTLTYENSRARSRAEAAERAEMAVIEVNRNLEDIVEHRTLELKARTTDLQTLTDSVAHDLRNPLNVLAVNIELLEDELDPSDNTQQNVLRRISPCIEQMTEVLDRLLDLSTLANSTFERESVDMGSLVQDTWDDLMATEEDQDVTLELQTLPAADADETLTKVLVLNLLSNALKYSRGVENRVVQVGSQPAGTGAIYFVRDNGVGFDDEQSDKIFNAFTRLDEDSEQDGIGLGLMLARKVILRHEGRIWAEGKSGEGATFFFALSPGLATGDNAGTG